jgi:hypothetical protein
MTRHSCINEQAIRETALSINPHGFPRGGFAIFLRSATSMRNRNGLAHKHVSAGFGNVKIAITDKIVLRKSLRLGIEHYLPLRIELGDE